VKALATGSVGPGSRRMRPRLLSERQAAVTVLEKDSVNHDVRETVS
jgi:hypothetical protein